MHKLECAVVVGCDGFHGVCRGAIPNGVLHAFQKAYPFAWLASLPTFLLRPKR
ncbi:MAG TPA: FAD-dependent monooxygenase [Chloroflexota bacterium]|nr:FAD-dependent monooxygenase [Chloroflexota bacterium]